MTWIDIVFIVLAIALVAIQSRRGFLQSALDLVAGLVAYGITRGTAGTMEGMAGPVAIFLAILAVLAVASYYLYNVTAFTIEAYDPLLGCIFGFALACVIGHCLYWAGDGVRLGAETPVWILDSRLASAFYHYEWWKNFQDFMMRLGQYD